jgi:hypothetical protein
MNVSLSMEQSLQLALCLRDELIEAEQRSAEYEKQMEPARVAMMRQHQQQTGEQSPQQQTQNTSQGSVHEDLSNDANKTERSIVEQSTARKPHPTPQSSMSSLFSLPSTSGLALFASPSPTQSTRPQAVTNINPEFLSTYTLEQIEESIVNRREALTHEHMELGLFVCCDVCFEPLAWTSHCVHACT